MVPEWSYENEWFEETNVSKAIVKFLKSNGYEIKKFNEDKRQKGHDIEATKAGVKLVLEVKGYPSDKYVRGPNKGKKKPTNPKLQAKHWLSEALLSLLIAKGEDPSCRIAIGLPKCERYDELVGKLDYFLSKLQVGVVLVKQGHVVEARSI